MLYGVNIQSNKICSGSFFLFGRGKEEWKCAITKLETVPYMEIQEALKISYDGLDYKVQNMFLDIACFCRRGHNDIMQQDKNA